MPKKTLVIGASDNPERYSYLAMHKLKEYGHPVVALGKKEGTAHGIPILSKGPDATDIDTITLYLNPQHQKSYYDYILNLKPKRIIFNPGTENEELVRLAHQHGIQPWQACTLVLLSTGQY